ncbi:hypothetical protein NEOLEDRAFT_1155989 [Neolentinus lepideus HHB14362 ss-1]|uniref:Aspartic peptidase DDI1-type domain-containing protein n=1 Tax=Neolentinus lepideus HHB14362 ss-1 TaxID=1314782 RepID=A0A165T4Z0_9AGAM|nr:hypothetical protein NEOLEDRAFT_1155989 [Neolentinus lepideus HHB14362 ss-1]
MISVLLRQAQLRQFQLTMATAGIRNLERTAARVRDFERILPKPIVVTAYIQDHPVRALLDTGSLSDFMSTTLVDQLKLSTDLAVTGSRSKVNRSGIDEERHFDVINLDNYDLILGTPFLYQHRMLLGFNPSKVAVGSPSSVPIQGDGAVRLSSLQMDVLEEGIRRYRDELREYAQDICKTADETPLPPLRAVNHTIPLIDEKKMYSWRPSRCPEALKPLWREKRETYVSSGRWQFRSGSNAMPMLLLKKPDKGDAPLMGKKLMNRYE